MGWATPLIEKLRGGETVQAKPRGNSMAGKIESGQLVTLAPVSEATSLQVGDIVLCRVHGTEYCHLIKAVSGERSLIGNNRGRTNGWIGRNGIP